MAPLSFWQHTLKALSDHGFWRGMGTLHTSIYRFTGGRVGASAGHLTHLLLTTTGRTSGAARTVPLTYMADGERFVLVASNGGGDRHPAWWLNLRDQPRATAQVRDDAFTVLAHEARGDERARIWPAIKRWNPFYAQYEQMTDRVIPVVVLTRAT